MELFRTFRDLRRRYDTLCRNHEIMYTTIRAHFTTLIVLVAATILMIGGNIIGVVIADAPVPSSIAIFGMGIWFYSGIWFGIVWMHLSTRIIPKYEILCECPKTDTSVTPGNGTSRK